MLLYSICVASGLMHLTPILEVEVTCKVVASVFIACLDCAAVLAGRYASSRDRMVGLLHAYLE